MELLVGCVLLSTLVALAFGILGEIKNGHKVVDKERVDLAERLKLEATLDQLFLKIVLLKEEVAFHSDKDGGLVFVANVGATMDALFFDQVLCKLHIVNGDFVLDQWPDPVKHGVYPKEMKREVILRRITKAEWSFYVPPNPKFVVQNQWVGGVNDEQPPPFGWSSIWKPGYKKIPLFLKLELKRGEIDYAYETYLPATSYPLELAS